MACSSSSRWLRCRLGPVLHTSSLSLGNLMSSNERGSTLQEEAGSLRARRARRTNERRIERAYNIHAGPSSSHCNRFGHANAAIYPPSPYPLPSNPLALHRFNQVLNTSIVAGRWDSFWPASSHDPSSQGDNRCIMTVSSHFHFRLHFDMGRWF